jgi:plastocyanin
MKITTLLLLVAIIYTVYAATFTVTVESALSSKFIPDTLDINEGDTVTWTKLTRHHNLKQVADSKSIKQVPNGIYSGPVELANTFSNTFRKNGTYYFVCEAFVECCNMRMTVNVFPKGQTRNTNNAQVLSLSIVLIAIVLLLQI